jgi:hypothetical protein
MSYKGYIGQREFAPVAKIDMNRDKERGVLIAPCGMNCGLCIAFLRSRNACPGCRGDDSGKPKTRVACRIKNCERRSRAGADYCGGCSSFPCELLIRLDKRYRAKYGMSMIENLKAIQASGIRRFIRDEQTKWVCPGCGEMLCVHKAQCLACQRRWR